MHLGNSKLTIKGFFRRPFSRRGEVQKLFVLSFPFDLSGSCGFKPCLGVPCRTGWHREGRAAR